MNFEELYKTIENEIIYIRRKIHSNPELGFEEFATSETICSVLDKYNISYKNKIAGTGILATIGNDNSAVLLIRADMDALPITENTGLEFTSQNKGIMHACGHDIHIASALAAAILLKKSEDKLKGTVKIMFQPAEETTGGALPMIEEGILKNPNVTCAIGGHVDSSIKLGQVKINDGPLMASPDDFELVFIGKSTHAAQPQKGISPIIPASKMVLELDKMQKEIFENNVLSVCTIKALGGKNIIPDKAQILGSFRSFDEDERIKADKIINETASKLAKEYNIDYEFTYNYLYPPLINDKAVTEMLRQTAQEHTGNVSVFEKPLMTGEDFAYLCRYVPSAFFWYGGGNSDNAAPLHNSEFVVDEDAIKIASGIFYKFAVKYLDVN